MIIVWNTLLEEDKEEQKKVKRRKSKSKQKQVISSTSCTCVLDQSVVLRSFDLRVEIITRILLTSFKHVEYEITLEQDLEEDERWRFLLRIRTKRWYCIWCSVRFKATFLLQTFRMDCLVNLYSLPL